MPVVKHGVAVCEGADLIFQHFLVDTEVGIGVKVVIFGRRVLGAGLLAAFCLAAGDPLVWPSGVSPSTPWWPPPPGGFPRQWDR